MDHEPKPLATNAQTNLQAQRIWRHGMGLWAGRLLALPISRKLELFAMTKTPTSIIMNGDTQTIKSKW